MPAFPGVITPPRGHPRASPRTTAGRSAIWLWLPLVAGLAVCAPFMVDAVRTLLDAGRHISMEGDTALLDLATRDFIRGHQLLGPYSRYGWHQPGPAVFAGLAGPVALFPRGAGVFLGTVLLDLAVLSTLMLFAWRRLHRTTVLWWAASVSAFVVVFGMGLLRRPWNPYMVILPMALFVVLCADALTGRWASLAWALVAGSYAVQTHVSTGAVVVVLGGVATASLVLRWWRQRRTGGAGAVHLVARRLTAAGFGVLVLMWIPPMIDVVRHRQSNLQQLWDFFTSPHPAHSLGEAARASLTAATILPFGSHLSVDHPTRSAAALGVGAAGILVLGAVAIVVGLRRGRPLAVALGALGLGSFAVGIVSATRVVDTLFSYLVAWQAVVPLVLLFGVGVALLGEPSSGEPAPAPRFDGFGARRPVAALLAVATAAVAVAAAVQELRLDPPVRLADPNVADMSKLVERQLGSAEGPVRVTLLSFEDWRLIAGLVLDLERGGHHTTVAGLGFDAPVLLGRHRRPTGREPVEVVVYVVGDQHAAALASGRQLGQVSNAIVLLRRPAGPVVAA